jgi:hypothetical protein
MTEDALGDSWRNALGGDAVPLEQQLAAESRLPGPRANLELAHRMADVVAATAPAQRDAALRLLTAWLRDAPRAPGASQEGTDSRSEYLAAVAALAGGALLAEGPDPVAADLLTEAAGDPRWRVRELAATGLQRVLRADWDRGMAQVHAWLRGGVLTARAAAAAVAEPPLLTEPAHAAAAARVVEQAVDVLLAVPAHERRRAEVRVLRKALGYACSVVAAADPAAGVPLLERLATSEDPDARWVARENLAKARLAPLAEQLTVAREAVSRA